MLELVAMTHSLCKKPKLLTGRDMETKYIKRAIEILREENRILTF